MRSQALKIVKDGSIVFKNVNFSYSNNPDVLNLTKINLEIKSGETIGIIGVGGTGSAKSALVQLIPRLYDVLDGELLVGGVNVKDYDIKTLRDNVAMVLQKNVLFSGTIKDNLRWGNENATDRVSSIKDSDKILVLEDGIITAAGTHDELLKISKVYREVYESQIEGSDK